MIASKARSTKTTSQHIIFQLLSSKQLTAPGSQNKPSNRKSILDTTPLHTPHYTHEGRDHQKYRSRSRNPRTVPTLDKLKRVPTIRLPQAENPVDPFVLGGDFRGVLICVE